MLLYHFNITPLGAKFSDCLNFISNFIVHYPDCFDKEWLKEIERRTGGGVTGWCNEKLYYLEREKSSDNIIQNGINLIKKIVKDAKYNV